MRMEKTISAVVLASALCGCGVDSGVHQGVVSALRAEKEDHDRTRRELDAVRQSLAEAREAKVAAEAALEEARRGALRTPDVARTTPRATDAAPGAVAVTVKALQEEANREAETLFQEAEDRLRARDIEGALAKYRSIARDYTDSPRLPLVSERLRQIEIFQQQAAERERQSEAAKKAAEEHQARVEQDRRSVYVSLWQKYDRDLADYNDKMKVYNTWHGYPYWSRSARPPSRPSSRPTPPNVPRPEEGNYPDRPKEP